MTDYKLVPVKPTPEMLAAGQHASAPDEVFAIPVGENGKRKTLYTEVLPFVPGPGVEVLGEPVRMVAAPLVLLALYLPDWAWLTVMALAFLWIMLGEAVAKGIAKARASTAQQGEGD